jgi:dipeptidyl aminopeptidase/acylaminoacyl peptidase
MLNFEKESGPVKISSMKGGHEYMLSSDGKMLAYRFSTATRPWELYKQAAVAWAKPEQITAASSSAEFLKLEVKEPEYILIPAEDGSKIPARLYLPEKASKNGAAVIFVHGAGYLQNAHKHWSHYFREFLFHRMLTDEGFTVLDLDYRGSAGYGRDWRTGIYRHMGGKDLSDQIDGARFLVKEKSVDSARIGIYGGSYGGFITLMALCTKPGIFACGAALRSVTDWMHYNHGYTSNILNSPLEDSIAYSRSSPINFAEGLKGRLLMCHGMQDLNVHYQDIVRFSQRLIELGKENWELASYPLEDHAFAEPESWLDEYRRIYKLFREELLKR